MCSSSTVNRAARQYCRKPVNWKSCSFTSSCFWWTFMYGQSAWTYATYMGEQIYLPLHLYHGRRYFLASCLIYFINNDVLFKRRQMKDACRLFSRQLLGEEACLSSIEKTDLPQVLSGFIVWISELRSRIRQGKSFVCKRNVDVETYEIQKSYIRKGKPCKGFAVFVPQLSRINVVGIRKRFAASFARNPNATIWPDVQRSARANVKIVPRLSINNKLLQYILLLQHFSSY